MTAPNPRDQIAQIIRGTIFCVSDEERKAALRMGYGAADALIDAGLTLPALSTVCANCGGATALPPGMTADKLDEMAEFVDPHDWNMPNAHRYARLLRNWADVVARVTPPREPEGYDIATADAFAVADHEREHNGSKEHCMFCRAEREERVRVTPPNQEP